jgi:thiamine biosynthesis lipoprotein
MQKPLKTLPAILALALFFASCAAAGQWREEFALGTICRLRIFEAAPERAYRAAFSRLRELEGVLSANLETSDLEKVNRNAGEAPVAVRPELIAVLSRALWFAEQTADSEGHAAFDPTIGPLVKLWDIGGSDGRVPSQEEIDAALSYVDWREVELDGERGTVFLRRAGMRLDLGAIAKGYAADEAAAALKREGVSRALIDLGGNIYALGERGGGRPFQIGLQDPREPRGAYIGVIAARDISVVTSGDYERFFESDGTRYHHILSSKTGFPVRSPFRSVTITAQSSIDADALSTAVFALGAERGTALIAAYNGAGSVFVFEDMRVIVNEVLTPYFHETPR